MLTNIPYYWFYVDDKHRGFFSFYFARVSRLLSPQMKIMISEKNIEKGFHYVILSSL